MPLRFPRLEQEENHGDKSKILDRVIKNVNDALKKKKHSLKVTVLGDSVFSQPRSYVSSGILPLDCIVCYGMGFPSGIVELFGGEASGKTAILENTLAEAQRNGFYTILFPTEYSVDYRRARILHLREDELIIGDAETIEDVYDQIKIMVRSIRQKDTNTPIVIGWDSIAATPTRSELENKAGLEASDMGRTALQMSKLFRRLVRFLFVNKVCLLCINQVRTNLGIMFGNKESTFGGKALKFYAWVRIRLGSTKIIEEDGKDIGLMCKAKVVKNKVAPPLKECRFPILWKTGIDQPLAIWEFAIDKEILVRKGTHYKYRGQIITRNSFRKFYNAHKQEIDGACRASVREK